MHDLDRTFMELEDELEGEVSGEQEAEGNAYGEMETGTGPTHWGNGHGAAEVVSESEVQELASELLSMSNEQEVEYFFDDLIKKVGGALGGIIGKPLSGVLKSVAKKVLPMAGAALGNVIAPGIGGAIGGNAASALGSMLGLELEGLSAEDREYEAAKQLVRLGVDAATQAAQAAQQGMDPHDAVREGMVRAAETHAPGLVQPIEAPPLPHFSSPEPWQPHHHQRHHHQHGRWVRRGNHIVLFGV